MAWGEEENKYANVCNERRKYERKTPQTDRDKNYLTSGEVGRHKYNTSLRNGNITERIQRKENRN